MVKSLVTDRIHKALRLDGQTSRERETNPAGREEQERTKCDTGWKITYIYVTESKSEKLLTALTRAVVRKPKPSFSKLSLSIVAFGNLSQTL